MKHVGYILFLLTCLLIPFFSYAHQDPTANPELVQDSLPPRNTPRRPAITKKRPISHAGKALLFGILPGGGQIYNQKYWKLPIIYGGLAAVGYFMVDAGTRFQGYQRAYKEAVDTDSMTNFMPRFEPDTLEISVLKIRRDQYQSRFEYATIGFVAFYALVLVDAFVDAHFKHFDVSDDLSMGIRPRLLYDPSRNSLVPSLRITVNPRRYEQPGRSSQPLPIRW